MARRKSPPPRRPKAPNGTALQQRIEFAYHATLNTPEGEVYQYLLRSPIWTVDQGKLLANDVILARWLPYARLERNSVLAQKTAQHSMRQLIRSIDELCRDFDLPHPFLPQVVPLPPAPVTDPPATPPDATYQRFDGFEGAGR
jgi:hypothetical protein